MKRIIICGLLAAVTIMATATSHVPISPAFIYLLEQASIAKTMLNGHVMSITKEEDKSPLLGATVTIIDQATKKKLAEAKTDARGFYEVDLSTYPDVAKIVI